MNDEWGRGFMRIQLALNYETMSLNMKLDQIADDEYKAELEKLEKEKAEKNEGDEESKDEQEHGLYDDKLEEALKEELNTLLESEDKDNNFIKIRLEEIYVWAEDFNNSIEGKGFKEREKHKLGEDIPQLSSKGKMRLVNFAHQLVKIPKASNEDVDVSDIRNEVKRIIIMIFGNDKPTAGLIEKTLEEYNIMNPRKTSIDEMLKDIGL